MLNPKALNLLRKERHLTQTKLARMSGVSVVSINHYEAGRRQPTKDMLQSLAKALGVKESELLNSDPRPGFSSNAMLEAQLELMTRERDFWKSKFEELVSK